MIRKLSAKRAKQNREYLKLREEFLNRFECCQVRIPNICNFMPETVHHKFGRQGKRLTDVSGFLAVCMPCHQWIELHPVESKENGYSLSRLT